MIGTTLGSYQLQRELGRGGMGAVYVGTHSLLGRNAAVKVLLPELSRNQDIVQRFFNEARAATAIKHPGIVEIYDFGFAADGSAFIVMEFLEGESLASRLKRFGRLAPGFAVAVARQIATALAVAHKAGIVHRDLKPDNVFLCPDAETAIGERTKLLDFGIAKLAGDTGGGLQKTSTGAIMGTPYYMSPEQCRGAGHVGSQSDLYAIGCILYEMIGGRVPFVGEGAGDIIAAHLLLPPPPLRTLAPDVPEALEALVMRLLAKAPADRPASAEALAQELATIGQGLGLATSIPPTQPTTPAPIARPVASTTLGAAAAEEVEPRARPKRTGLVIGVVVVALAGAAAAAVVMTRGSSTPPAKAAAGRTPAPTDPPPPPSGDDVHLIAARTAIETELWTEAAIEADAALRADPTSDEAKQMGALARREGAAQVASNQMAEAIAASDLAKAAAQFAAIPEDSRYKQPAMVALTSGREQVVLDQTPAIKALIAKGKCKDAKAQLATLVAGAGTGPTEPLTRALARCKSSSGISAGGVSVDDPPDKGPPPKRPEPCAGTIEDCTGQSLKDPLRDANPADEAGQAFKSSQYGKALRLAEAVLDDNPGNKEALLIAGLAACQLKDADRAKKYADKLGNARATQIKKMCERQGVSIEDAY